jgi:hypothetical protein
MFHTITVSAPPEHPGTYICNWNHWLPSSEHRETTAVSTHPIAFTTSPALAIFAPQLVPASASQASVQ